MKRKICLLIALGLGMAPSAFAAKAAAKSTNTGAFVSATLGASYLGDMQDTTAEKWTLLVKTAATTDTKLSFESGFNYNVSAGYRMDNLSLEGEIGGFSSDVGKATITDTTFRSSPINASTADIDTFKTNTYMLNAHYAYPMSGFSPRVGLGLGIASVEFSANNKRFNTTTGADDSSTKFAYQFILGVDKAFGAASAGLEYRYLGISSNVYEFDSTATVYQKFAASAGSSVLGVHIRYNI